MKRQRMNHGPYVNWGQRRRVEVRIAVRVWQLDLGWQRGENRLVRGVTQRYLVSKCAWQWRCMGRGLRRVRSIPDAKLCILLWRWPQSDRQYPLNLMEEIFNGGDNNDNLCSVRASPIPMSRISSLPCYDTILKVTNENIELRGNPNTRRKTTIFLLLLLFFDNHKSYKGE